ncbi:MAG: hypothetical protein COU32_04055 [Candidatus Magasanikbacteria bacterium CG10_big_fil_rev_8_21_14_0_10_42_10]|uniref:Uncharacterized protein n=2 Tax=Candidatus Magasanikiibacteriota TaxID=1752731 RepID=A0A2H0TVD1_9BACT|nr:MAG: hypothetical protein COU32_04055 [Candidatus Magasanikbacteria bacterium CG10_big_fil_rev_8_21_14_0_10_42_10]PIZ94310.1 MAG: hypothetical protein COX82_00995 [Candidatus Magasanikbacteria bacterium CG_4_10_14_0_2_um_filter_41_10]
MASFERIFNLAKKTGDRMIVFDSTIGDGFAAIPIDEYEAMVTDPRNITSLSGDELLEQINDDIAVWRAHQEDIDREEFADTLEDSLAEEPPFDPFGEDFSHQPEWHSASDILQDRYKMPRTESVRPESDHMAGTWHDDDFSREDMSDIDEHPEISFDFEGGHLPDDVSVEDLPYDDASGPVPVPPATQTPPPEGWQEEPLDEEPIFFEEPIE